MNPSRPPYPTDVSDDEWAFVAPYLTLLPEDAGQRTYSLREVFNGLRWIARAAAPWRLMPNDLPPWWVSLPDTFLRKRVMEEKRTSLREGGEEQSMRSSHQAEQQKL